MYSLKLCKCPLRLQYKFPKVFIANIHNETTKDSSTAKHYDIIIAGGGMVGSTLACTIGKNPKLGNKNILLLEGGKPHSWQMTEKYSNRVVALNPATYKLFNKIDAWKHIKRFGVAKQLHVWDALSDSLITFNNEDDANEIVAYIVENNLLLNAIDEELKSVKNISVVNEAKISECIIKEEHPRVMLENGNVYSCDLLLGCDGANSKVRKAMDIPYIKWNYEQKAIVATLKLSEANENFTAWQRFLPSGPIALLPLKENLSSLVWSTSVQHADQLLNLNDDQFVDACNEALCKIHATPTIVQEATKIIDNVLKATNCSPNSRRQLPPKIEGCEEGSRASFPLGFGHSANYVARRVVLVGDAAHRVHPMAGQGVNLGFGDVECIDRLLGEAIYNGATLDDGNYLKRYESERQRHNVPTMLAIDGLHRLYNTEFTPFVLLRSVGLQISQVLSPLKRSIIRHAAS